jgi:hypothetical protein
MLAAVKASFSWMAMDVPEPARRIHDAALLHRQPGQWNDSRWRSCSCRLRASRRAQTSDKELDYHVQALVDMLATPTTSGEDAGQLADRIAEALVPRSARARARSQRVWQCLARAVRARLVDSDAGRLPWRAICKSRLLDFASLLTTHAQSRRIQTQWPTPAGVRACMNAFRDWLREQPLSVVVDRRRRVGRRARQLARSRRARDAQFAIARVAVLRNEEESGFEGLQFFQRNMEAVFALASARSVLRSFLTEAWSASAFFSSGAVSI